MNRLRITRTTAKVICSLFLFTTSAPAQDSHFGHSPPRVPPDVLTRPLPIRDGIGKAHDTVSTSSEEAQAFYDQGLAYLHSFVWIEAARSFSQTLKLDPQIALAYVGLSYAYVELNDSASARSALEKALALSARVDEHDRRHIEVRAAQMAAESEPHD